MITDVFVEHANGIRERSKDDLAGFLIHFSENGKQ
jgi:hypothetical protein